MNTENSIRALMIAIQSLQTELNQNPNYSQDMIDSISADIDYYQNQIDYLVNE